MEDTLTHNASIQSFLNSNRQRWTDYNVPYEDGQELEKLILHHDCKQVLEIGTSSGHASIWMAKAVAQTGGRVTTIEMNESRWAKAKANFEKAGVAHLIDLKLGDAMAIIPTLEETFDFIFSDATWHTQPEEGYLNFFKRCEPKLAIGGLYTMHNVTDGYGDDGRFFDYVNQLGNYSTSIIKASSAGISVSKKLRP